MSFPPQLSVFVARICFFLAVLVFVLVGYFWSFKSGIPESKRIAARVYHAIDKSIEADSSTTDLILGDSVCEQMYPNDEYDTPINSLACNQGVSLVGYYNLLDNFLKNFKGDKSKLTVHLIYRPSSFRNNLDQRYTFNYFLKPFYCEPYLENLTDEAHTSIQTIPYYWLAKFPLIRESNWAPMYRAPNRKNDFRMAPIAADYLKKCKSLCDTEDIDFRVRCPFMSKQFSDKDFDRFRQQLQEYGLEEMFEGYFDDIVWLDARYFFDDVHLNPVSRKKLLTHNFMGL